jgi:hypothetical protein
VAIALLATLTGCGDTVTQPAWVAAHPDTALLSFRTTAPGVCAITVQYPNDAPAVISYLGGTYVQVSRQDTARRRLQASWTIRGTGTSTSWATATFSW